MLRSQAVTPSIDSHASTERGTAGDAAAGRDANVAPAKRVPDFFIVGHHKCGTTALYEMLRGHPQIFMPDIKEPRFFASDLLTPEDGRTLAELRELTPLPATLDEYLSLFDAAKPDQRAGEATPLYLLSSVAASAIAEVQPDARIIAILREPASYLRSLHLQLLQDRTERVTDFRKAINLEPDRRQGKKLPRDCQRPQRLMYSERVRYVEQLSRYHAVFAPEQVLVLIYDDFRRDNEATVRIVLRFIEVDDGLPIGIQEANPTVLRRPQVEDMLRAVSKGRGPVGRTVKTAIKALTPQQLRNDAFRAARRKAVAGKPPPVDERFMIELRRRFKPEVEALSEYLNRDLVALWDYDALD